MRNIDNRNSVLFQIANQAKQFVNLSRSQRRSRLIHDKHACGFKSGAGYFDKLAISRTEVCDTCTWINVEPISGEKARSTVVHFALVDEPQWRESKRFTTKKNVFRYREMFCQREFLIDHCDASREGIGGAGGALFCRPNKYHSCVP